MQSEPNGTTCGESVTPEPTRQCPRCIPASDICELLTQVAMLLDGWHQDGTAWTVWDEEVRQAVSAMLIRADKLERGGDTQ